MSLTHKPDRKPLVYKTWADLDEYLQYLFSVGDPTPSNVFVDPADYEMSKQEIIDEASKAGYEVTERPNGFLKFT